LTSSIKENPKLRAAAEELKKAGLKVGDAVGEALKTMEESEVMRAVSLSFPRAHCPLDSIFDLVDFQSVSSRCGYAGQVYRTHPQDRSVQNTGRNPR